MVFLLLYKHLELTILRHYDRNLKDFYEKIGLKNPMERFVGN